MDFGRALKTCATLARDFKMIMPRKHHEHTFSAFWLRSSVVSVLISMTTDMLPKW